MGTEIDIVVILTAVVLGYFMGRMDEAKARAWKSLETMDKVIEDMKFKQRNKGKEFVKL